MNTQQTTFFHNNFLLGLGDCYAFLRWSMAYLIGVRIIWPELIVDWTRRKDVEKKAYGISVFDVRNCRRRNKQICLFNENNDFRFHILKSAVFLRFRILFIIHLNFQYRFSFNSFWYRHILMMMILFTAKNAHLCNRTPFYENR